MRATLTSAPLDLKDKLVRELVMIDVANLILPSLEVMAKLSGERGLSEFPHDLLFRFVEPEPHYLAVAKLRVSQKLLLRCKERRGKKRSNE